MVYAITGSSLPGFEGNAFQVAAESQLVRHSRATSQLGPITPVPDWLLEHNSYHAPRLPRCKAIGVWLCRCIPSTSPIPPCLHILLSIMQALRVALTASGFWTLYIGHAPLPVINSAVLLGSHRRVDHEPVLADFLTSLPETEDVESQHARPAWKRLVQAMNSSTPSLQRQVLAKLRPHELRLRHLQRELCGCATHGTFCPQIWRHGWRQSTPSCRFSHGWTGTGSPFHVRRPLPYPVRLPPWNPPPLLPCAVLGHAGLGWMRAPSSRSAQCLPGQQPSWRPWGCASLSPTFLDQSSQGRNAPPPSCALPQCPSVGFLRRHQTWVADIPRLAWSWLTVLCLPHVSRSSHLDWLRPSLGLRRQINHPTTASNKFSYGWWKLVTAGNGFVSRSTTTIHNQHSFRVQHLRSGCIKSWARLMRPRLTPDSGYVPSTFICADGTVVRPRTKAEVLAGAIQEWARLLHHPRSPWVSPYVTQCRDATAISRGSPAFLYRSVQDAPALHDRLAVAYFDHGPWVHVTWSWDDVRICGGFAISIGTWVLTLESSDPGWIVARQPAPVSSAWSLSVFQTALHRRAVLIGGCIKITAGGWLLLRQATRPDYTPVLPLTLAERTRLVSQMRNSRPGLSGFKLLFLSWTSGSQECLRQENGNHTPKRTRTKKVSNSFWLHVFALAKCIDVSDVESFFRV